jgi:phosphotransferase system  glucose/maltose/N-acetylglucosamine-specific IIC component
VAAFVGAISGPLDATPDLVDLKVKDPLTTSIAVRAFLGAIVGMFLPCLLVRFQAVRRRGQQPAAGGRRFLLPLAVAVAALVAVATKLAWYCVPALLVVTVQQVACTAMLLALAQFIRYRTRARIKKS